MKKVIILLIVILLSGCVFSSRFVKENTTETQYMKDRYYCESWASDHYMYQFAISNSSVPDDMNTRFKKIDLYFIQCMEEHGYKLAGKDEGCLYKREQDDLQ